MQVSDGQPADQPKRLFADVHAEAEARADSRADNIEAVGASGPSSVENEEIAAAVGEAAAESVRREEPDAREEEGMSVLDSDPEMILPEIAVEVAETGAVRASMPHGNEERPSDGSGVAAAATVVAQEPALAEIKPVEAVPMQENGAAVETQAIDAQGVSGEAAPAAMADEVVLAEEGPAEPETPSPDSVANTIPKAEGQPSMASGGTPDPAVAADSSLMSAEGRGNGVEPLDELSAVQRDSEAAVQAASVKEASTAEEKSGATSPQPEPQAVEPGSEALREIEKGVGDRQEHSHNRDGAGDAAFFAQPDGPSASQAGEEQANSSDFSAAANVAVGSGGLMEPDTPVASGQSAGQTLAPGSAPEASQADAAPSIRDQILDSMQVSLARDDQQLVVRLHPPELGNVVVRFQGGDDQIDATLEVSKAETRYEVEQALPQVVKGLQDSGVHITRFEVVVADEPERDLAEEQTQQRAWSEQQNSDPDADRPGRPVGAGRSAGDGGHQRHLEYAGSGLPPVGQATDHIDLLV